MMAGGTLFDFACEIEKWWLRGMNPGASEDEIRALLRKRVEEASRES